MKIKLIGFVLIFTILSAVAAAQTNQVTIGDYGAASGQEITAQILILNGVNVGGAAINLSYNPSVVNATNVVALDPINFSVAADKRNAANGYIIITGFVNDPTSNSLSGDIKVASVTLRAVGTQGVASPLNLSVSLVDDTGTPISSTVVNGSFTIRDTIPPAIISNPQITTGNFWINNTWVNPSDSDFDHVWFRYSNGTTLQNVSTPTNYLNKTWQPHYTQNLSAQTVDTTGNINSTMVWFNATIPNNAPLLAPVGNKVIDENQTLTIALSASDADGDTLTYSTNRTDLFSDFNTATGTGNWTPSFTQAGIYYVNFAVSDGFGGIASETIQITVNNVPPPNVANPSAKPSEILLQEAGNADYAHMSTTLNATVTAGSGVANVTINLSSIGGSPAAVMTAAGGNVYSITINATGTSGFKLLGVNATDIFGNSNTSVTISLKVTRNGDVNDNGNVDIGDVVLLRNNITFPGDPRYALASTLAADVNGDGLINIGDAVRLRNYITFPEDPRYILN